MAARLPELGLFAGLTAAASYGVGYVYIGRFLTGARSPASRLTPLSLATAQMSAAAGIALLALPLGGLQLPRLEPLPLLAVGVLGVFGTGIAFALNYRLISDEGATTASTVAYLIPVVSVLLGRLVLGEQLGARTLLGMAIVLAGVAFTRHRTKRSTELRTRRVLAASTRTYADLAINSPGK